MQSQYRAYFRAFDVRRTHGFFSLTRYFFLTGIFVCVLGFFSLGICQAYPKLAKDCAWKNYVLSSVDITSIVDIISIDIIMV